MATTQQTEVPAALADPAVTAPEQTDFPTQLRNYIDPRKWLESSSGRAIPLLIAMAIIWLYFEAVTNGNFFSPGNVTNILVYTAVYGIVAVGVTVVLLLGEIDLSLGSLVGLAGCCSAAVMIEPIQWGFNLPVVGSVGIDIAGAPLLSPVPKLIVGLAVGIGVGLICGIWNGFWVAVMKIPSFVVTLAGLLAFYGLALVVTNSQTLEITDDYYNALGASSNSYWDRGYLGNLVGSNSNVVHLSLGMAVVLIAGAGYTLMLLATARSRARAGLPRRSVWSLCAQSIALTVALLVVVEVLDKYQGVPIPLFIFMVTLVVFSYITRRTRFGRHIFATGGNAEAARRAGIAVRRVRWSAFIISGLLAGLTGIIFMARVNSANGGNPDQSFLLLCIASAVIGGTSLFGGRGSIWGALTGALMISSVQTGMGLTLASNTNSEYYEYIVEAAILLGAVWLDTYGKSRSTVDRGA